MDEIIKTIPGLMKTSPYAFAFVAAVFIIMRNGGSDFLKNWKPSKEFVKREDCHSHVDNLKKDIEKRIDKLYDDVDNKLNNLQKNITEFIKAVVNK